MVTDKTDETDRAGRSYARAIGLAALAVNLASAGAGLIGLAQLFSSEASPNSLKGWLVAAFAVFLAGAFLGTVAYVLERSPRPAAKPNATGIGLVGLSLACFAGGGVVAVLGFAANL